MSGSVTSKRLLDLRSGLSDRDWQIVATLARVRLASVAHLEALHFCGLTRRRTQQALTTLSAERVIKRLDRVVGGVRAGSSGHVYALDVAGQRLADLDRVRRPRPPRPIGAAYVSHVLAVTEVYVQLVLADRRGDLDLARFVAEPGSWRSYFGPGGGRIWLKPDAYIVAQMEGFEDHWFMEMDCGTESAATVARKLGAYVQYWRSGTEDAEHAVFPRVLWLVRDGRRQDLLAAVIARQPSATRTLFDVTTADQVVRRLAAGAGS